MEAKINGEDQYIIVIDDEPLVLQLTQVILERAGYNVLTAHDCSTAKTVIKKYGRESKAFVLDYSICFEEIENMTIFDCIDSLIPAKPVLFISGDNLPAEQNPLLSGEKRAFIHKPFKIDELTNALDTLLGQSSVTDKRKHRLSPSHSDGKIKVA